MGEVPSEFSNQEAALAYWGRVYRSVNSIDGRLAEAVGRHGNQGLETHHSARLDQ